MKKGLIYCLKDPRTNLVRYIGQTVSILSKRYNQHLVDYKRRNCKVNSWIKSLASLELKPIIEIIEDDIDQDKLDNKEIAYIALFKSVGANLKNHTIGGKGHFGERMTEKAKEKRKITNQNSERMKEKHKNHSIFMKEKFEKLRKLGIIKPKIIKVKRVKIIITKKVKIIYGMNMSGNNLKKFKSYKEAAIYYKLSPGCVADVCKKKRLSTKGYRFYSIEQEK